MSLSWSCILFSYFQTLLYGIHFPVGNEGRNHLIANEIHFILKNIWQYNSCLNKLSIELLNNYNTLNLLWGQKRRHINFKRLDKRNRSWLEIIKNYPLLLKFTWKYSEAKSECERKRYIKKKKGRQYRHR